ncbi:Lipase [Trema orientale]|uniref:Lipase n=1 Tax=Trema orientale TaxID=63057 RepID=A0A2P5CF80_TREOI|nr:Lipase [Trema orientale]
MRPLIVLFGDSITEESFKTGAWGASLTNTYSRKADVLVRGYGGYNTRWALFLLRHLFPRNSEKPPAVVTIFFGANDAAILGSASQGQHVPVDEYKENLKKIECSPTVFIVLITPPPVGEDSRNENAGEIVPERINEVTGLYAKKCIELAKEMGLPSINLWSKMQETEDWQNKFLSDGLHLTPEGNDVVHQEVTRVFSEAWFSAPDMPYDFPPHSEIDSTNPGEAFQ